MVMVDVEVAGFREPDSQFSNPVTQATHVDNVKSLYHEAWLNNMLA